MSIKYILAAIEANIRPAAAKLVLIALADNADTDTGRCWPSIKTVARRAGISERSARGHIKALEDAGVVVVDRRMRDGVNLPNIYTLVLSKINGTAESAGVLQNLQGGGAESAGGVVQNLPPNQSLEPVNEPISSEAKASSDSTPDELDFSDRSPEEQPSLLPKPKKPTSSAKPSPRSELLAVLDSEHAEAVLEHRQRLRKPLTTRAAKLLAGHLAEADDPNDAADTMIEAGWAGFKLEWYENRRNSNGQANGNHYNGSRGQESSRDRAVRILKERLAGAGRSGGSGRENADGCQVNGSSVVDPGDGILDLGPGEYSSRQLLRPEDFE